TRGYRTEHPDPFRREGTDDAGDARALARRTVAGRGDPGRLCGFEPCGKDRRRGRRAPAPAPRRGSDLSRRRHLGHALRRHAGGVGMWAIDFVGMLAARLPTPINYLVFPTLLSFLVCVLVVGAAVFAATAAPLTPLRLALAAAFMGSGIASMHYIGMAALHESAHLMHAPNYVAASIVIAIAASGLALWLPG